MTLKKPEIKVGDRFTVTYKKGGHSNTFGGQESAGQLAHKGKVFTVLEIKSGTVLTADNTFCPETFSLRKVEE